MYNMLMPLLAATQALIPYKTGQIIGYVLMTVMVVLSIALITVVMMQKSDGEDMSAITGGNKNDSFLNKNKTVSNEAKKKRATVGLAVCLMVFSIAYFIILSISGTV